MALIPTRQVEPRETVSIRLGQSVHERLQHYAAFIQSPKEYVIAQALERLFRHDRAFARWLVAEKRFIPQADTEAAQATTAVRRRERV
jgi:predicted transcriptional regulator